MKQHAEYHWLKGFSVAEYVPLDDDKPARIQVILEVGGPLVEEVRFLIGTADDADALIDMLQRKRQAIWGNDKGG